MQLRYAYSTKRMFVKCRLLGKRGRVHLLSVTARCAPTDERDPSGSWQLHDLPDFGGAILQQMQTRKHRRSAVRIGNKCIEMTSQVTTVYDLRIRVRHSTTITILSYNDSH